MSKKEQIAGNVANYVDERTGAAKWLKKTLTKVFPDHWSFLLGEVRSEEHTSELQSH